MNVRRSLYCALAALLPAIRAGACDIPVYQYAREHWAPDLYQVVVLNQGPLDAEGQELVANLEQTARQTPHANFVVQTIDGDGPRLEVHIPAASPRPVTAWEGPLSADAVATVADSPCRREIARRLLAGDAVVWVLLQTGRKDADDEAGACIEKVSRLATASGKPPPASSLVRVSRDDPAETLLVKTLLSSEPDLPGRDEPMAFPVFGRGRVLYALCGAGINAETVRHALDFLVGGCSCTIKHGNPGTDLLLTADWGDVMPTLEDPPDVPVTDELVRLTPLPPAPPPARPLTAAAPPGGPKLWLIAGVCAAAALVLATGVLALRSGKRPPRP